MKYTYSKQWIDEEDIKAVADVLCSDLITQGPKIAEFEDALAEKCGAKYAVAVNSGTAALHIACLAAGVKPGDETITSPNTFVASANCAVYCNAKPLFSDISPKTYNILPEEIEKIINPKTRAVIPVHFAGQSSDMDSINRIVRNKEKELTSRIFIIEDACQALGSIYKGNKVGSCTYSDMTVMSFHPVKHITTGEGGAVLTNDKGLYKKLKRFRNHGITNLPEDVVYKEEAFQSKADDGVMNPWYYEQVDLGYNYRITDIQCALGTSQLKKLDRFMKRRREIVAIYNEAFGNVDNIQIPFESEECDSNFHLYVLLFEWDKFDTSRAKFMNALKARDIHTQVHYIPVHTQPFYQKNFGTSWGDCPNAEDYYKKCLSIPLYQTMSNDDVGIVISIIKELLNVE